MGLIDYLEEMEKRTTLEEEVGEVQRLVARNLLKDTDVPLEKIALLTDVSQETTRKLTVLSIIDELAENKRKEVLEACRVSEYGKDYSFRFARDYTRSYKDGLLDGFEIVGRRFVETLLKRSGHSMEEIASLADMSVERVAKIKDELHLD